MFPVKEFKIQLLALKFKIFEIWRDFFLIWLFLDRFFQRFEWKKFGWHPLFYFQLCIDLHCIHIAQIAKCSHHPSHASHFTSGTAKKTSWTTQTLFSFQATRDILDFKNCKYLNFRAKITKILIFWIFMLKIKHL